MTINLTQRQEPNATAALPSDIVVEKCRQPRCAGGSVIFRPRYRQQPPHVVCEGCGVHYDFLRKHYDWIEAAFEQDARAQIVKAIAGDQVEDASLMETMTAEACARTAAGYGQLVQVALEIDKSEATRLKGEQFTPHDYYRLARRAGRYAIASGLAILNCERCGDPLTSADGRRTGYCDPCLWTNEHHDEAVAIGEAAAS